MDGWLLSLKERIVGRSVGVAWDVDVRRRPFNRFSSSSSNETTGARPSDEEEKKEHLFIHSFFIYLAFSLRRIQQSAFQTACPPWGPAVSGFGRCVFRARHEFCYLFSRRDRQRTDRQTWEAVGVKKCLPGTSIEVRRLLC